MTDGEKFEAWFRAEIVAGRMYGSDEDGAWSTWQASRRAALEEAAVSFDKFFSRSDMLDVGYVIGSIRALSQKDPQ